MRLPFITYYSDFFRLDNNDPFTIAVLLNVPQNNTIVLVCFDLEKAFVVWKTQPANMIAGGSGYPERRHRCLARPTRRQTDHALTTH